MLPNAIRAVSLLTLLLVSSTRAAAPATAPAVRIVSLPDKALVPDVAVDGQGIVHMVYGLGDNAYYMRSADDGATFTQAVKVNSAGKVQLTMGERGPKLGLGKDGSIHVVWADRWSAGAKCFVRYARSLDGGKTFEAARGISSMPGVDGATMAADGEGHVLVFWHVFQPAQKEVPQAHYMYLSRSADNGATFAAEERVKIANLTDLACSMCMMRARIAGDQAYLAFRSAEKSIRDFYVLKGPVGKNEFTALRVNEDNWKIDFCPMCGPEMTFDAGGRALVAFMTSNKIYWSSADAGAAAFKLHVATPANEKDEIYPCAVANRKGEVLLLWQVGPMSVSGTAIVKWAIYDAGGRFAGQQGTVGTTASGTKATAFVGADDGFRIVTTATPAKP